MAIRDRTFDPRLAELGRVRLGELVQRRSRRGDGMVEVPVETPYFVLKDAREIADAYGERPTSLPIYFPFPTPEENFTAWYELYAGRVCVCRGDGVTIHKAYDRSESGGLAVTNGVVVAPYYEEKQDGGVVRFEPGAQAPCSGHRQDLYPKCRQCSASGLLTFIVRDPQQPERFLNNRLGVYVIRTKSTIMLAEMLGQMTYVFRAAPHGDLRGIPYLMRRIERTVSYTDDDGQPKSSTHYIPVFEIDPAYIAHMADRMRAAAFEEPTPYAALPSLVTVSRPDQDEDREEYAPVVEEESAEEPTAEEPREEEEPARSGALDALALKDTPPPNWEVGHNLLKGFDPTWYNLPRIMNLIKKRLDLPSSQPVALKQGWPVACQIVADHLEGKL